MQVSNPLEISLLQSSGQDTETVCETVQVEDCLEEPQCRQVEEEVCQLVQDEVCTDAPAGSEQCAEVFDTVVEDLCTTVNIDTCNDITETICEVLLTYYY